MGSCEGNSGCYSCVSSECWWAKLENKTEVCVSKLSDLIGMTVVERFGPGNKEYCEDKANSEASSYTTVWIGMWFCILSYKNLSIE